MATTTEQMLAAPDHAFYIWPAAGNIHYAHKLAASIGRTDLNVVSAQHLGDAPRRYRGMWLAGVVVDHACVGTLTYGQQDGLKFMHSRVRFDLK